MEGTPVVTDPTRALAWMVGLDDITVPRTSNDGRGDDRMHVEIGATTGRVPELRGRSPR